MATPANLRQLFQKSVSQSQRLRDEIGRVRGFHAVSVSGNALVLVPKTAPIEKIRACITIGDGTDSDFEGLGLQRPK
jgi:hypothetical protein